MERKRIGLIILGILALIFIVSYLHRSKSSSKTSKSSMAYVTISGIENDSTASEWMLGKGNLMLWEKSVLSKQRRHSRDPFKPALTKPRRKSASIQNVHFRLEGIIARSGYRKAIINGKTYSVGDWVSDKKVVEIGDDYVILHSSGNRQVLNLFN